MALDDTIGLLAQTPLFGLLERDALRLLAFSADARRLRAGEVLFRRGERSDGGYVVLEGELTVFRNETEPGIVAGPGSLLGQVALFVRLPRPSTAVASAPTRVLRISPTLMKRVLQEFPSGAAELRNAVAAELDELTAGLERVRRSLLAIGRRRGAS